MKKFLPSEKIYIKNSKIKNAGRGVFAKTAIKKGEVIEVCPIINIPEHDLANLNESILNTYFFFYGKRKEKLFLALGFGSVYNHFRTPNAKYKINEVNNAIEFRALENIKANDEITVNYINSNIEKAAPLWFEVN